MEGHCLILIQIMNKEAWKTKNKGKRRRKKKRKEERETRIATKATLLTLFLRLQEGYHASTMSWWMVHFSAY